MDNRTTTSAVDFWSYLDLEGIDEGVEDRVKEDVDSKEPAEIKSEAVENDAEAGG